MPAPTIDQVHQYVGTEHTRSDVEQAYRGEKANQSRRCRVPADDAEWPDDLAEALNRRVLAALALKGVPLGVEVSVSETGVAATRVGGLDPVVRRLEAVHVKKIIG